MFPIGIATIAAVLRKEQYPITFLDPENMDMNENDTIEKIKNEKPTVVGVSSVSANFPLAKAYLEAAKAHGAFTILGGNHASADNPESILKQFPCIDFVLFGEADYTVRELCAFIEQGRTDYEKIQGLAYRRGKEIKVNPKRPFIEQLDDLPQPVWDLVNMDKYNVSNFMWCGKGAAPLITSRGCPTF